VGKFLRGKKMTILDDVRVDLNSARKKKDGNLIKFLSFLVAQIELVGKNDGNRQTTDAEAVRQLKKLVSSMKESVAIAESVDGKFQIHYMEFFIPSLATESEIKDFVDASNFTDIKSGMTALKARFGENIDMKMASKFVKEKLGV
jgi:uncharacterized protein